MADESVQVNIDLVKAAEDVVQAVAAVGGVFTAERSVIVEIDNQLAVPLTFDPSASDHDHGGFGQVPQGAVQPMGFDIFTSRSSGFAVGTEGHVFYNFKDGRKLFVHWDNPFGGGNSADGHVEPEDVRYRVIALRCTLSCDCITG